MKDIKQPDSVVRRLPRYYRYLADLIHVGIRRISSRDLSERIGNTSSQVRQDFFCFGGFGQQGYGYDVQNLHDSIGKILGIDQQYNMVVIGAGHLGQALANHFYLENKGFKIIGVFDIRTAIIGKKIRDIEIIHFDKLEYFVQEHQVDIAILTMPREQVNEVAKKVIELGINGIWNFVPVELRVADDIVVENIQLSDSLMVLGYRLKEFREIKDRECL